MRDCRLWRGPVFTLLRVPLSRPWRLWLDRFKIKSGLTEDIFSHASYDAFLTVSPVLFYTTTQPAFTRPPCRVSASFERPVQTLLTAYETLRKRYHPALRSNLSSVSPLSILYKSLLQPPSDSRKVTCSGCKNSHCVKGDSPYPSLSRSFESEMGFQI